MTNEKMATSRINVGCLISSRSGEKGTTAMNTEVRLLLKYVELD